MQQREKPHGQSGWSLWEKYPDVRAPGFVDDLDTVYRDAAFTIAPIHNGGGTNIKIIESLAYGRACVTTLRCANAFGATLLPQKGIVVADNDIAWVSNCTKLLLDQEERTKLAECGRKFAVNAVCCAWQNGSQASRWRLATIRVRRNPWRDSHYAGQRVNPVRRRVSVWTACSAIAISLDAR